MKLSRTLFISAVALMTVVFVIQLQLQTQAQDFDRAAMLEGMVTETILPLHQQFAAQTVELEAAGLTFAANPSSETLAEFQDAWRDTSIAFEYVRIYGFQRVMPLLTQIENNQTNLPFVEGYIEIQESGAIDAAYMASRGSSSKGLPVLEYLIFVDDALEQLTATSNRMDYAIGLATDIRRVADELVIEWTPETDNFADRFIAASGEVSSVRSGIAMLANEMFATLDGIVHYGLANPLGYYDGGDLQPDQVLTPYSNISIAKLIARAEAFQIAFNGAGDVPAMADYLDYLNAIYDNQLMSQAINEQVEQVVAALDAIDIPLQTAIFEQVKSVENAYDEARTLLRLVRTDMSGQLGVTVTFSDNDGD